MLQVTEARLSGAKLIVPRVFEDVRGFLKETYVRSKYQEIGVSEEFVHDSLSYSSRNVVRGLHAVPHMAKLVQVFRGEVFDVIVDVRRDSKTFGQWQSFHLTDSNHRQVYMPAGFLHGFLTLTDDVVMIYKQDREYDPLRATNVIWNDPDLAIEWPISVEPTLSDADRNNRRFREVFPS